jgi:large subunit ribosomal protein L30
MALQVTQVKSSNGAKRNQLATLETLGLRRIRHTVVVPDRPEFRGMVATVNHLVAVEEVPDGTTVAAGASRELSASDAGEPGAVGTADTALDTEE